MLTLDFQGFKMVKEVSDQCAFDESITVIDVKLDVYGPKEDLFYSTFPFLIKNVRRGNTIIKVLDKEAGAH